MAAKDLETGPKSINEIVMSHEKFESHFSYEKMHLRSLGYGSISDWLPFFARKLRCNVLINNGVKEGVRKISVELECTDCTGKFRVILEKVKSVRSKKIPLIAQGLCVMWKVKSVGRSYIDDDGYKCWRKFSRCICGVNAKQPVENYEI